MNFSLYWASVAATLCLVQQPAVADTLTVMISGGFNTAYASEAPDFEGATGHHLVTVRGPSMGTSPDAIPNRLARGGIRGRCHS